MPNLHAWKRSGEPSYGTWGEGQELHHHEETGITACQPSRSVRVSTGSLYSFAIDGKLLPKVTTISRINRDQSHKILGYQRPRVLSHISEIRNYLNLIIAMIPDAIVVAHVPDEARAV